MPSVIRVPPTRMLTYILLLLLASASAIARDLAPQHCHRKRGRSDWSRSSLLSPRRKTRG